LPRPAGGTDHVTLPVLRDRPTKPPEPVRHTT